PASPAVLHSFPTRRSSDLTLGRRDGVHAAVVGLDGQRVLVAVVDLFGVHERDDGHVGPRVLERTVVPPAAVAEPVARGVDGEGGDRKSTRLNSSHVKISYA